MKNRLLIVFATLIAPGLLSLYFGLASVETAAAVNISLLALSEVSQLGLGQIRADVEEAKRLIEKNRSLLEQRFGAFVEIDPNSLTADSWQLKAKNYLTAEDVEKIRNDIRNALDEIHVAQYLETIPIIVLDVPAKPEPSPEVPKPPVVIKPSNEETAKPAIPPNPLDMAKKLIEDNRSVLEQQFGEFVEIDLNSLTNDGWQLKAKKYLTTEEVVEYREDIKQTLVDMGVGQYLEKVMIKGFVRLDVDPDRIIELSTKEWSEELRQVLRMLPEVDEQNKTIRFVTGVPGAAARKESLRQELKNILSRYGFSAFAIIIDSLAEPDFPRAEPRPSPKPTEPVPPIPVTSSTMPNVFSAPVHSVYTPRGHVCFLKRFFSCFATEPCLPVVDPTFVVASAENIHANTLARPTLSQTGTWNNPELIDRLVAVFQPEGAIAERVFGNRPTTDVIQVSYESLKTSLETSTSAVHSLQLANEIFGRGAHLYWQGDYKNALQQFELGITSNPEDARLWYFKGFCELALGRNNDAEKSIVTAIVLHEKTLDKREVSYALERVQGKFRVLVESLRPRAAIILRGEKMKTTGTKRVQLVLESRP